MSRRVAAWVVAATFLVTMVGTTLPTPLYPLYQQRFGFGGLMVTVIFATYAVGVMAALLLVGRLSDQIGRRAVLLPGLACAAASGLAFLISDSVPALFLGRVLSGLSAGIFTGTATATIIDLAPADRRARAGLVAAAVNMLGLGLGPVVAGFLAQYARWPLQLPYLVHLILVGFAGAALWFIPEPVERARGPVRLRVQRLAVPAGIRGTFIRATIAGFAGFAVLGLFTAVSPSFLDQVLHQSNHLLDGAVVFAVFGASTAGQLLSAALSERISLLTGCLGLVSGVVLIGAGIVAASLGLIVAGAIVAGLGQGMSFRAGLSAVGAGAPPEQRSEVTSSLFLILYIAISLPVIGVGAAGQAFGLVTTGVVFAGIVAVLAIIAFVSLLLRNETSAGQSLGVTADGGRGARPQ
jgi:predicted MFS family arabinose efflux permease